VSIAAATNSGNLGHIAAPTHRAASAKSSRTGASSSSSSTFVSLLQLLTSPNGASLGVLQDSADRDGGAPAADSTENATSAYETAAPDTVADALIRAMLGLNVNSISGAGSANAPLLNGSAQSDGPAGSANTMAAAVPAGDKVDVHTLDAASGSDSAVDGAGANGARRKKLSLPEALTSSMLTSMLASMGTSAGTSAAPSADAALSAANGTSGTPNPLGANATTFSATSALPGATSVANSNARSGPLAFGANLTAQSAATSQDGSSSPDDASSDSQPPPFDATSPAARSLKAGADAPITASDSNATSASSSTNPSATVVAEPSGRITTTDAAPSTPSATLQTNASSDVAAAEPPSPAQTPQNMVLHVAAPSGDANQAVDIRVAQRAGEIQVTVHTADPALQANLRQDLPSLVTSLDRAGFDAQTFVPHASPAIGAAAATSGSSFDSGSTGGQSATGGQSDAGSSNGGANSGSKDSATPGQASGQQTGGQQPGGEQFSGQHQTRDRQTLRWLDQIEE